MHPHARFRLHSSIVHQDINSVRQIIKQGYDVNEKDYFGATALHLTAQKNELCTAQVLLENGAIVDVKDGDGTSSLLVAAFRAYTICASCY